MFGALKGVLIGSVFLLASSAFVPQFESMIKSSKIAPEVTRVTEKMISIVPFTVKEQFYDKLKEFKKAWQTEKKIKQ